MDALVFAKKLTEGEVEPAVDRWAEQVQDFIAKQTIYFVRQIDRLPASFREDYWETLSMTLRSMPEDFNVEVTHELFERLRELAPTALVDVIDQKVYASNGRKPRQPS